MGPCHKISRRVLILAFYPFAHLQLDWFFSTVSLGLRNFHSTLSVEDVPGWERSSITCNAQVKLAGKSYVIFISLGLNL